MKKECRAKNPIYCPYHGVPAPSLSLPAVKKDLKATESQIAKIAPQGITPEYMELQKRKVILEQRLELYKNRRRNISSYHTSEVNEEIKKEENDYIRQVIGRTFGWNSKEYEANNSNIYEELLRNPDHHEVFYLEGHEDDARGLKYDDYRHNDETRAEIAAYIAEHDLDGFVDRPIDQFARRRLVPFKLKEGQMNPAEWRAIMRSDSYKKTRQQAIEALTIIQSGKLRKLAD